MTVFLAMNTRTFQSLLAPLFVLLLTTSALAADSVVVLMYHRFGEDKFPSTSIRIEQFSAHLNHLKESGYAVVPLADVHAAIRGEGGARVGVIDFQDALKGHAAYDLVSLLQDARRDISADLEGGLYAHYCEARGQRDSGFERDAFRTAYAVLGAQRNSKILGIFARLAKRDGKHGYLAHIPRVSAYLERNLAHSALKPLRAWFDEHLPRQVRAKALDI